MNSQQNNSSKHNLPFCPLISQCLKKNNNLIFKKSILNELFDYLCLEELLSTRYVCKQWDEIIKTKIPDLQSENIFELPQKRKYKDNDLFDISEKKFSKKKVLINLLHSKNYNIIKKRASLKCMTKAKTLID
jgi:hypothetical protein